MKTVPSNDVRRDFTDIANKVKYTKESYIVTNQNKPSVGIVPIEFLMLLPIIRDQAIHNEQLANALKDYITFITDEDVEFLDNLLKSPKQENRHLNAAAKSLSKKLSNFNTYLEHEVTENDHKKIIPAAKNKQKINPFTGDPVSYKEKYRTKPKYIKASANKRKSIKD